MRQAIDEILRKIRSGEWAGLWQFLKFGLVGVSNTAVTYGTEMLGYYVLFAHAAWPERTRIVAVTALGFLTGTANSYFWNNRFVFSDGKKKSAGEHLRAFLRMAVCYGFTGLILSPLLKVWLSDTGVPYWLASPLTLIVTVPLNYVLNKRWAFGKGKK